MVRRRWLVDFRRLGTLSDCRNQDALGDDLSDGAVGHGDCVAGSGGSGGVGDRQCE